VNSAGWLSAEPAASSADRARIAVSSPVVKARTAATAAWATEARPSTRTPPSGSVSTPATGASRTIGSIVAAK
jgi:hypothetical protein